MRLIHSRAPSTVPAIREATTGGTGAAAYLRAIWPNTPDAISELVSESFAEACIAAGDAFPEGNGTSLVLAAAAPVPGSNRAYPS